MSKNDQIILDQVLEQERQSRNPHTSKSDFFEKYVSEQVLKDADLSDEEIESGLVGSGGDGGIDGLYVFANGELVREDFDVSSLKKNIVIDVVVTQAKQSPIEKSIKGLFSAATVAFEFWGAAELLAEARRRPTSQYELAVLESISARGGYIALVILSKKTSRRRPIWYKSTSTRLINPCSKRASSMSLASILHSAGQIRSRREPLC